MDEQDFHCPNLLSGETIAKGTGLAESVGKKDPYELDTSPALQRVSVYSCFKLNIPDHIPTPCRMPISALRISFHPIVSLSAS